MSGLKRTEDLHTLKTKQLVMQNPDGSFPQVGSVLAFEDSRGHVVPTQNISVSTIEANNLIVNQSATGVIQQLTTSGSAVPASASSVNIIAGSGITCATTATSVTISSTGGGGGVSFGSVVQINSIFGTNPYILNIPLSSTGNYQIVGAANLTPSGVPGGSLPWTVAQIVYGTDTNQVQQNILNNPSLGDTYPFSFSFLVSGASSTTIKFSTDYTPELIVFGWYQIITY